MKNIVLGKGIKALDKNTLIKVFGGSSRGGNGVILVETNQGSYHSKT